MKKGEISQQIKFGELSGKKSGKE